MHHIDAAYRYTCGTFHGLQWSMVQAFISCRLDYCNSLLFGISDAWSQAPVGVTTSHQCYGSCTGCQSVSALCSRSRGSYISRLVDWLPLTSQTTVAFCRTLVVAHCGPTQMTFGSCLFHEHITNSVIGVSQPPVLDCGTTFNLDSGLCGPEEQRIRWECRLVPPGEYD